MREFAKLEFINKKTRTLKTSVLILAGAEGIEVLRTPLDKNHGGTVDIINFKEIAYHQSGMLCISSLRKRFMHTSCDDIQPDG